MTFFKTKIERIKLIKAKITFIILLNNEAKKKQVSRSKLRLQQQSENEIKIIINEIIFTDTKSYIIISNPKNIEPLKTIRADRILGKNAKTNGTFRLGTVISSVTFCQGGIKAEPNTTTSVGICILLKTSVHKIKAGTPVTIQFENNIKPEIGLL